MSLKTRINDELKAAMKAQNKERVSVLRMLLSEVKYAQAAVNIHEELPDAEVLKVLQSYHKRLQKSLEDYPAGEKQDAIRQEMTIVEDYLPKKANADEIRKAVSEALKGTEDRTFGTLMKAVMASLGTAADGKAVSEILKSELAKS